MLRAKGASSAPATHNDLDGLQMLRCDNDGVEAKRKIIICRRMMFENGDRDKDHQTFSDHQGPPSAVRATHES